MSLLQMLAAINRLALQVQSTGWAAFADLLLIIIDYSIYPHEESHVDYTTPAHWIIPTISYMYCWLMGDIVPLYSDIFRVR